MGEEMNGESNEIISERLDIGGVLQFNVQYKTKDREVIITKYFTLKHF